MDDKNKYEPTLETNHVRPNVEEYEYAVYDSHSYHQHYDNNIIPIVLVMKYQEGFEWNEEVFFSSYRQQQCKRHKSKFRKAREEKIRQACIANNTGGSSNSRNRDQDRVMEIELSAHDKDILP
ncbi:unnamed protein product [Cunninghamella echinulata]